MPQTVSGKAFSLVFAFILLLLAGGLWVRVRYYSTVEPVPHKQSLYRSFYAGQPVSEPESLSGVWEVPDGRGGAVGIDLRLTTYLPGAATSVAGFEQTWQGLDVGIYQRDSAILRLGEENDSGDSEQEGSVRYEDGRLTLNSPGFDLDLVRLPGDRWSGRLHRRGFDAVVVLTRAGEHMRRRPGFVGTWRETMTNPYSCLHVADPAEGNFNAWFDSHQVSTSTKCPVPLPRPAFRTQVYGERVSAQSNAKGDVLLDSPASQAACCSHSYVGVVARDGRRMHIMSATVDGGAYADTNWAKMPGSSCTSLEAFDSLTRRHQRPASGNN